MGSVLEVNVRPERKRNGKFVLYKIITFDEHVPGTPALNKTKKMVWPRSKLANGRGRMFNSRKAAIEYFVGRKHSDEKYGERTGEMLKRFHEENK